MKTLPTRWIPATTCLAVLLATVHCAAAENQKKPKRLPGQVTEPQLGTMLQAIGLRPEKTEKRYDFKFPAIYKGEKWDLSMSTVLSRNERSIWVMAWLDKIPNSAADVPRTALLRLLAANDSLGKGKFFTYIPSNKRFVLQRTVPNAQMTTDSYRAILQDLGMSVIETYPAWSVANWKRPSAGNVSDADRGRSIPPGPAGATRIRIKKAAARRSSSQDSRLIDRTIR